MNTFDTFSPDENMLLLLGILGGLLLVPIVTLLLLYRLCARAFERTKSRELQKLVTDCAE